MRFVCALALALIWTTAVTAQQSNLSIELNTQDQVEKGCQLTFVASTDISGGIDKVVLETVLFSPEGSVDLLTLFDFAAIPADRPRVRQFILPNMQCDGIGKILINGIQTCSVADHHPAICDAELSVSSRTNVEIQG